MSAPSQAKPAQPEEIQAGRLPTATRDLRVAKSDLEEFGYCAPEGLLEPEKSNICANVRCARPPRKRR